VLLLVCTHFILLTILRQFVFLLNFFKHLGYGDWHSTAWFIKQSMATNTGQSSLKSGHRKATRHSGNAPAHAPQPSEPSAPSSPHDALRHERQDLINAVRKPTVKKAWFTMAHLLLESGARIVDVGSKDGAMTYAMASLNPDVRVSGLDIDESAIKQSQKQFARANLDFHIGSIFDPIAPNGSVDAFVNSFVLHEIYSANQYNDRVISRALANQYRALKNKGFILIRDFILPSPSDYVLMEFKDSGATSDDILTMSEADLLVHYSEHARDQMHPEGAGFFLEELPPTYPRTRLFRLPMKWAYEFLLRKDNRENFTDEMPKEYAFFTEQDFRKELRALGARILYSAPHWDEGFIKTRFDGKVRLYREDGSTLGPPPTSHIIIAQKIEKNASQIVQERRTSRARAGTVYLRTVRDERTGAISDIASRDLDIAEVIPFRITQDNKLKIYLHEGVPRGLANAAPRAGKNLDGRRWSGHMIEAIALQAHSLRRLKELSNIKELLSFSSERLGIKASADAQLIDGPGFFPDPYRIDEKIETYYYRVENHHKTIAPPAVLQDIEGFSNTGFFREFDAQAIMNAIAVGYLPSSRLETQILALFKHVGIRTEVWSEMPLQISELPEAEVANIKDIVKDMSLADDRFKTIKGSAGNIRLIQSRFVDEGRDQGGGMTGLAARDMEFIVQEDTTINTAVVLPLVRDLNGEVLAGVVTEYLPVPQRYNNTGMITTLPSFPLPKDVTDVDGARRYVADKFNVDPKFVARMGESYFTHIGLTPHRIYPFVVTNIRGSYDGFTHGTTQLTMLKDLWKLMYWDNHDSFIKLVSQTYNLMCQDNDLSVSWDHSVKLSDSLSQSRIVASESVIGSSIFSDVKPEEKRESSPFHMTTRPK
jgi:SAM-dependent methyltransferase